jgi:hypothetical protein
MGCSTSPSFDGIINQSRNRNSLRDGGRRDGGVTVLAIDRRITGDRDKDKFRLAAATSDDAASAQRRDQGAT